MRAKDAVLRKFFQNVDVALRGSKASTGGVMLVRTLSLMFAASQPYVGGPWGCCDSTTWGRQAADGDLEAATSATATAVHERLCDSVDTRGALDKLLDLIAHTNKYLEQRDEKGGAGGIPFLPVSPMPCGACEGKA